MTIVVAGDDAIIEQIQKQLEKLVEVQAVKRLDYESSVRSEIALIKVDTPAQTRSEVVQTASIFSARVIDVCAECLTIEATGDHQKIDSLIELLKPYGIRELARTGVAALERGSLSISLLVQLI
jgi:acetolactate synthase-1/3 small subunit